MPLSMHAHNPPLNVLSLFRIITLQQLITTQETHLSTRKPLMQLESPSHSDGIIFFLPVSSGGLAYTTGQRPDVATQFHHLVRIINGTLEAKTNYRWQPADGQRERRPWAPK